MSKLPPSISGVPPGCSADEWVCGWRGRSITAQPGISHHAQPPHSPSGRPQPATPLSSPLQGRRPRKTLAAQAGSCCAEDDDHSLHTADKWLARFCTGEAGSLAHRRTVHCRMPRRLRGPPHRQGPQQAPSTLGRVMHRLGLGRGKNLEPKTQSWTTRGCCLATGSMQTPNSWPVASALAIGSAAIDSKTPPMALVTRRRRLSAE